jgi:hypothetical protein
VRRRRETADVEGSCSFDGTIAMALDPQGALFALFAGEVDP